MAKQMLKWKPSYDRLYGHSAIEFCYPDGTKELAISSSKAEIWAYSETHAGLLCRSDKLAYKVARALQVAHSGRILEGDEHRFLVPNSLVPKVIDLLYIPKTRPAQARAANGF